MSQWGNLGVLKLRLIRYACSDAYDRDVKRVLDRATAYLERRVSKVTKPAIVLDVDETALSNWPEIVANDIGFIPDGPCDALPKGPCGWHAWVASRQGGADRADAGAVQGGEGAGRDGVLRHRPPRRPQEREATERNLRAAGYDGWGAVMMRRRRQGPIAADVQGEPARQDRGAGLYDHPQRRRPAQRSRRRSCGEDFLVPNPFYFIP